MISGRRRTTDRRNLLVIVVMVLIGCSSGPPAPTGTASGQPTSTSPGTTATHTDQGTESPPPEVDYTRTSEARIAAGLAAGEIDYQTSLLYRVYAAFGSAELPAEYRSKVIDTHAATFAFKEIEQHSAELSPDIIAALAPYLARPNEAASIFSRPGATAQVGASTPPTPLKPVDKWVSKPAAGGKARVWTAYSEIADALLDLYAGEVDRVWPKVFSLTREPIPDEAGEPLASVNEDSAIDLYFVELGTIDPRVWACHLDPASPDCTSALTARGGYTRDAEPRNGRTSSSYVVIDAAAKGPLLDANIAHELTHTSQNTYDRFEGFWLLDSTATWAEYRTMQLLGLKPEPEYWYLGEFFDGLDKRLDRDEGLIRYGSWLYFFSLQIDYGDQILPRIFEKMAAEGEQNAGAVDEAFAFQDNFGNFAVSNWNRDTADRYRKDTQFPTDRQAKPDYRATMNVGDDQLEFETTSLSADYASYTFADEVRKVIVENPFTGTVAACNCIPAVWLLPKVKGQWQAPQQLTAPQREYCFARPDQDLDELVLIVANPGWQPLTPLTTEMMPTLTATDEECELADVEGTITWSYHETYHDSGGGVTHDLDSRRQATISVRMNEGERGFEDAGSSFAYTGDETNTETDSNCTLHHDTQFEGAGPFSDHGLQGAWIGLRDNGDGTWTLSATVAGTMHSANAGCPGSGAGGEQETIEFVGCTDDGDDLGSAYTELAVGTLADDGLTIAFRCEETVTEPNEGPLLPAGQRTLTITLNGTLNRTTRSPAGP